MPADRLSPSADYLLIFDGGSRHNPEFGHGSYLLVELGVPSKPRRLEFGPGVTSNQAEYRALIAGLGDLLAALQAAGRDPADLSLEVRGDSSLVINQLRGQWKVRHPGLQPLHREASQLLNLFGQVRLTWTPRSFTVRTLGH